MNYFYKKKIIVWFLDIYVDNYFFYLFNMSSNCGIRV